MSLLYVCQNPTKWRSQRPDKSLIYLSGYNFLPRCKEIAATDNRFERFTGQNMVFPVVQIEWRRCPIVIPYNIKGIFFTYVCTNFSFEDIQLSGFSNFHKLCFQDWGEGFWTLDEARKRHVLRIGKVILNLEYICDGKVGIARSWISN